MIKLFFHSQLNPTIFSQSFKIAIVTEIVKWTVWVPLKGSSSFILNLQMGLPLRGPGVKENIGNLLLFTP